MNITRHSSPLTTSNQSPMSPKSQFKFIEFRKCKEKITNIFNTKITPVYGDQKFNLDAFEHAKSRRCEAMKIEGKLIGVISYMHNLQKTDDTPDSFEVRNLVLVKDKYSDKGYEDTLLQRVLKLAQDRKARNILFRIASADISLVDFLKARSFTEIGRDTISKDKKEAVIFSRTLEYMFSQQADPIPSQKVELFKEKKTEKRERDDEDRNEDSLTKDVVLKTRRFEKNEDSVQTPQVNYNQNKFSPIPIKFDNCVNREHRTNAQPRFNRSFSTSSINENGNQHKTTQRELTLRKVYIHQIRNRLKTVEGRIWSTVRQYNVGDTIRFFYGADPFDDVVCRIVKIEKYNSFPEMLESCGYQKCLAEVRSLEQAKKVYNDIPNYPERAAQHGVAAIHLEVIS